MLPPPNELPLLRPPPNELPPLRLPPNELLLRLGATLGALGRLLLPNEELPRPPPNDDEERRPEPKLEPDDDELPSLRLGENVLRGVLVVEPERLLPKELCELPTVLRVLLSRPLLPKALLPREEAEERRPEPN